MQPDTTPCGRFQRSAFSMSAPRSFAGLRLVVGQLIFVGLVLAGEPARKAFNVPTADAAISLRLFAEQAGQEIIYPVEDVKGVTTNAVKGDFTAREAIERLVAATDLVVAQSKTTGALAVSRKISDSNSQRTEPPAAPDHSKSQKKKIAPSRIPQNT